MIKIRVIGDQLDERFTIFDLQIEQPNLWKLKQANSLFGNQKMPQPNFLSIPIEVQYKNCCI